MSNIVVRPSHIRNYFQGLFNRNDLTIETYHRIVEYAKELEAGKLKANSQTTEEELARITFLLERLENGGDISKLAKAWVGVGTENRDSLLPEGSTPFYLCSIGDNVARAVRQKGYTDGDGNKLSEEPVSEFVKKEMELINPVLKDSILPEGKSGEITLDSSEYKIR